MKEMYDDVEYLPPSTSKPRGLPFQVNLFVNMEAQRPWLPRGFRRN